MGKPSLDKGKRVERRIVHMLCEAGMPARRVVLSGGTDYAKGDVEFMPFAAPPMLRKEGIEFDWEHAARNGDFPQRAEVKARKQFPAWLLEWLGDNDCLFLVEDRKEPLVILRMSKFTELVG